jgi:hypothetical protein
MLIFKLNLLGAGMAHVCVPMLRVKDIKKKLEKIQYIDVGCDRGRG